MTSRKEIMAGQLRRWKEEAVIYTGTFLVLEERINRFGSGPGDAGNTVTYLQGGRVMFHSIFQIRELSEVISESR